MPDVPTTVNTLWLLSGTLPPSEWNAQATELLQSLIEAERESCAKIAERRCYGHQHRRQVAQKIAQEIQEKT